MEGPDPSVGHGQELQSGQRLPRRRYHEAISRQIQRMQYPTSCTGARRWMAQGSAHGRCCYQGIDHPFLGFYVCSIGFACWLTCIALALRLGYIMEIGPMIMIEIKVARRFLDDRTLRFEQTSTVCQTTVLW